MMPGRPHPSLGGVLISFTTSIPYTSVKTAALTKTITVATLPAKGVLLQPELYWDQFTGTNLGNLNVSLQRAGGLPVYRSGLTISGVYGDPMQFATASVP